MPPRRSPSASASAWSCWPGRSGSRSTGPAHLSGLVWPNIAVLGGFLPSSFVATGYPSPTIVFFALGGYEGAPLASGGVPGLGPSAPCSPAASLVFWRDRRLWFFGFALVLCVSCSLRRAPGQWEPARVFFADPGPRQRD